MQITCQSILSALGFLSFILAQENGSPDPTVSLIPQPMKGGVVPPGDAPYVVKRPKHSQCYNYFLSKDNCVFAAAKTSERCSPNEGPNGRPIPEDQIQVLKAHQSQSSFSLSAVSVSPEGLEIGKVESTHSESSTEQQLVQPAGPPGARLVRRYDSEDDSFTIGSGTGICGTYTDDTPGVCLWASADNAGAATGGWLSGGFTKACGRVVYIQRQGADHSDPNNTIYAPVIDGCKFEGKAPDPGCFRIAFTKATFKALKPTEEESNNQIIKSLIWDFANEDGSQPQNAAP